MLPTSVEIRLPTTHLSQNDGKANHFYINDIYENEMEEESMMTLDRIMANMPLEEREIIMDKMVAASRDILKTICRYGVSG